MSDVDLIKTQKEKLKEARKELDWIGVIDIADTILLQQPNNLWFSYQKVLALARTGQYQRARELYEELKLDQQVASEKDSYVSRLNLKARLIKDEAIDLRARGQAEAALEKFRLSAEEYRKVLTIERNNHSAICAAAMYFVADDKETAMNYARAALDLADVVIQTGQSDKNEQNSEEEDKKKSFFERAKSFVASKEDHSRSLVATNTDDTGDWSKFLAGAKGWIERVKKFAKDDPEFYPFSVIAQANLILGEIGEAEKKWKEALAKVGDNWDALLSTLQQIQLVATEAQFKIFYQAMPDVGWFSIDTSDSAAVPKVNALGNIKSVDWLKIYGRLHSVTDLALAIALFKEKLPMTLYVHRSIDVFRAKLNDDQWDAFGKDLERMLANPSVTPREISHHMDDLVFQSQWLERKVAAAASLRAIQSQTQLRRIVVNGDNVETLTKANLPEIKDSRTNSETDGVSALPTETILEPIAVLMGDFAGFSKLSNEKLPTFVRKGMGAIAKVVKGNQGQYAIPILANTWGDGLFVVYHDVESAAVAALGMQSNVEGISQELELSLRLGGHFGLVQKLPDPITGQPNYFGDTVALAARIEPITKSGQIFVSHDFAAELALKIYNGDPNQKRFRLTYMGVTALTKNYGNFRIYRLSAGTKDGMIS